MSEIPKAPQLVINSRIFYVSWVPADPGACAALLPDGLAPADNRAIFLNQYVVDKAEQTSHFGAYSLTYMGLDLNSHPVDADTPGRWWIHYINSSAVMRAYAAERGIPATAGATTLELEGGALVATTCAEDGTPLIRSIARVGEEIGEIGRGHLRYITQVDGSLVGGLYAFVGELVTPFEVESIEFLAPDHSTYALRPADPLEITFGFYSPRASFCYPGGVEPL